MRNSLCILSLLALLLCACSGSGAKAQTPFVLSPQPAATNQVSTNATAAMNEKGYVLGTNGGLGTLYLKFPGNWKDRIEHVTEKERTFDAVYFTPTGESDFDFMVEIARVGDKNNANHEAIKSGLLRQAQNELTNAVETNIVLKDFRGDQTVGSYFRITDKKWAVISPPEGEAKYMTEGYASVGPLILTFHLFSNRPVTQEAAALEVIKTARYSKTKPPGTPSR
jgi:hypothetical protein